MDQNETFDFTNTPDDLLLPDLFYNWEITGMEVRESGSNKTHCSVCGTEKGKKMIAVEFTVIEPVDYQNAKLTENFVIGIEADPCAHLPATLAGRVFGSVYFKQLLKAVQVPLNQMALIKGKRCQRAVVTKPIDARDGGKRNVNNFASGSNGMLGVYPVGTVPVGQPTPDTAYPKGGTKQPSRPNGGVSNPAPTSLVPCPRCKKEFPGDQIDDHMADCLGS